MSQPDYQPDKFVDRVDVLIHMGYLIESARRRSKEAARNLEGISKEIDALSQRLGELGVIYAQLKEDSEDRRLTLNRYAGETGDGLPEYKAKAFDFGYIQVIRGQLFHTAQSGRINLIIAEELLELVVGVIRMDHRELASGVRITRVCPGVLRVCNMD